MGVQHGHASNLLFLIPLVLAGFTHLWNPTGFPSIYVDEGHYLRRAIAVLEGSGHQESSNAFNGYHPYDHPYFGQIFLAFLLKIVDYPSSVHPVSGDVASIQMLHMVPRIFMGLLAVVDTFLVYKISVMRYNRTVALAASILFAVMPMTWLLKRILLDSILLPLLLSSILFAVYYNARMKRDGKHSHEVPVIVLSGIFLGLAIFTKIPAFCMVPLVGYLITTAASNNKKWMILGIWIIPVILIPTIWPAYAILYGQLELWEDGVLSQTSRIPRSLFESMKFVFEIDPVLMTLGILGVVWMTIRRDFFFPLWILPYIIFLGLIGYSQYIHMVLLFPLFSMAAAILIQDFSNKLGLSLTQSSNKLGLSFKQLSSKLSRLLIPSKSTDMTKPTNHQQDMTLFLGTDYVEPAPSIAPQPTHQPNQKHLKNNIRYLSSSLCLLVFAVVSIFGLINTILLITTNVNGSLFEAYAAFVEYLPSNSDNSEEDLVTLTSSVKWGTYFYWIPRYVFDKELTFLDEKDNDEPATQKIITIGGRTDNEDKVLVGEVNNTARYFDLKKYPYNNMKYNELGNLDVMGNY